MLWLQMGWAGGGGGRRFPGAFRPVEQGGFHADVMPGLFTGDPLELHDLLAGGKKRFVRFLSWMGGGHGKEGGRPET